MTNGNEPAMPFEYNGYEDREPVRKVESGLTKREYFAAMALQGLMAVENKGTTASWSELLESGAEISVKAADALIKELNKTD